jgi:hypothetical protein
MERKLSAILGLGVYGCNGFIVADFSPDLNLT